MKNILLMMLAPFILAAVSCQFQTDTLDFANQTIQEQVSQTPDILSSSGGLSGDSSVDVIVTESDVSSNSEELSESQNRAVILGQTQVRVQFDPAYGWLYPAEGKPTQNPVNLYFTTGYTIIPPQEAVPYKAGCTFKGWSTKYPYEGAVITEEDLWDFDNEILMEGMSLYAYFEESDTPDPVPAVQAAPSYSASSNLYDYPLQDVPDVLELGKEPNESGFYEFFATGVSKDSGWLNNVQYKNHCWATSASQMIYWYQGRINEIAGTRPEAGFTGGETPVQTDSKVLELRDWFGSRHELAGRHIAEALNEYFDANYPSRKADIISYRGPNDATYFTLETISKILLKHLSRGDICGLTAVNFDGGRHAMNIYGAEFDAGGNVQTIYVTSSPTFATEEEIRTYVPKLYEFKYNGTSRKGAPQWIATYYERRDGYLTSSQNAIQNIYRLDFLSVERYK